MEIAVGGRFLVNSMGMIHRLAKLDQGVAILPAELVAEDLAQGPLVPNPFKMGGAANACLRNDRDPPSTRQDTLPH